jgi:hypothetical protein
METIKLNGETYTFGEKAITTGMNMRCDKVVAKGTLQKDDDGIFWVNGNIWVKMSEEDLKGIYVDTPANRQILKATF